MQVGVQYQGDSGGPKLFARRAEQAGLDSLWCGDHVAHLYDGLAVLACFAGATDQITIGLNVLVTPYRSAAVTAKALATIALAAPGRVVAGFGVGGEFPAEFTATGADPSVRGAYTDEALGVITRLWSGAPVSYRGRWNRLDEFQLEPPPAPPPEVWIGGRSEAALRRAVRFGRGYTPYLVSPDQLAKRVVRLGELAAEAGRSPQELTVGCLCTLVPGVRGQAAVDLVSAAFKLSGLTPEAIQQRYLLGGDDEVLARLQRYVDAGARHLILGCVPGDPGQVDEFFAACERLAPAARRLTPSAG
ncbi:MAG: LLM class flavin-dependent oxidoreductase [Acidimicrobiales bacterium]